MTATQPSAMMSGTQKGLSSWSTVENKQTNKQKEQTETLSTLCSRKSRERVVAAVGRLQEMVNKNWITVGVNALQSPLLATEGSACVRAFLRINVAHKRGY